MGSESTLGRPRWADVNENVSATAPCAQSAQAAKETQQELFLQTFRSRLMAAHRERNLARRISPGKIQKAWDTAKEYLVPLHLIQVFMPPHEWGQLTQLLNQYSKVGHLHPEFAGQANRLIQLAYGLLPDNETDMLSMLISILGIATLDPDLKEIQVQDLESYEGPSPEHGSHASGGDTPDLQDE
jgi:hypothetical protein